MVIGNDFLYPAQGGLRGYDAGDSRVIVPSIPLWRRIILATKR